MITLGSSDNRRLALEAKVISPALLFTFDATSVGGNVDRYTESGLAITVGAETWNPQAISGVTNPEHKGDISRDIYQVHFVDADHTIFDRYSTKINGITCLLYTSPSPRD